jgi:2-keto-4-pentenoate hydratase/2-oxohepta-3-ene-1,7-dioic acid hydratase in catechol pathway
MAFPIARPSKIICAGLNYRDHADETGIAVPRQPVLFAKWPNSLIGPGDPIVLPPFTAEVDYEAELAVVIGRRLRDVSAEHALDAVSGVTCLNDVSARDLQFADGGQWTVGKSLDTFCPVGPRVVPLEEIGDPQRLGIRCVINGEVLQESNTANMIFSIAELIAFASRGTELEPGDLIATGTPAGVGFTRNPPRFLSAGDEVTVELDGVGTLTNPVVQGAS